MSKGLVCGNETTGHSGPKESKGGRATEETARAALKGQRDGEFIETPQTDGEVIEDGTQNI